PQRRKNFTTKGRHNQRRRQQLRKVSSRNCSICKRRLEKGSRQQPKGEFLHSKKNSQLKTQVVAAQGGGHAQRRVAAKKTGRKAVKNYSLSPALGSPPIASVARLCCLVPTCYSHHLAQKGGDDSPPPLVVFLVNCCVPLFVKCVVTQNHITIWLYFFYWVLIFLRVGLELLL
ncbi:hypothetical protein Drorol1_Dr00020593, partial [Drosera rotundifolia]